MHTIKDTVKQLIGKSLDAYNTKYTKVLNTRIDNIVAQAGNDNTEILDARIDSAGVTHTTLNNRILAETKMVDQQMTEYIGYNLTATETMPGAIQDLEVLGNTIQNVDDLSNIKSVGELQEDGTYKMSILSCGKNLSSVNEFTSVQTFKKIIDLKSLPNGNYKLSLNISNVTGLTGFRYYYKDGTFKLFADGQSSGYKTYNVEVSDTSDFIAVWGDSVLTNIQLEEGTVATPYEPYQENKCDILLPCQLEKVGNVSDRLYYDDVEKAWCIEKNILNTKFKPNAFHSGVNLNLVRMDVHTLFKFVSWKSGQFITELVELKNGTDWDNLSNVDKFSTLTGTNKFDVLCSKEIDSLETFNKDITIIGVALTPQKIVLPLDTQIQLNSFFGTTHIYMESGEVEGTIKCKIPKSLGATVQSLNNKTDILSDRIEAIEGLKDSQNMKYETDKGYLVCKETKNGVIDDLKIEGKTLVNLCQFKDTQFTLTTGEHYNDLFICYTDNLKLNTNYTFMYDIEIISNTTSVVLGTNVINQFGVSSSDIEVTAIHPSMKINGTTTVVMSQLKNHNKALIQFVDFKGYKALRLRPIMPPIRPLPQGESITYKIKNMMLLEGDHTQNPPSYFEGLMSVGEDVDKIEVLSVKGDGNLVEYIELNGVNTTNGKDYTDNKYVRTNYITVEPNQVYYIKPSTNVLYKSCSVYFYDSNKSYLRHKSGLTSEFTTVANTKFIRIDMKKADDTSSTQEDINNCDFVVSKCKVSEYIPHQSDKKQILFYNENGELEPIQELHEWDSIEKHSDNKLYYHKRSGKIVLNGSESIYAMNIVGVNTIYASIHIPRMRMSNNSPLVCDKFKCEAYASSKDYEYIYTWVISNNPYVYINFSKDKGTTKEEFKQWLQANNVTVVYQLAQEEVYEIAPLHLDSYANETLILCDSGAISPRMEFSITSHINELIKSQGDRISLLEEKVYQYMIVQNRIQLTSMYNSDSVAFKVNYTTYSEDDIEYNEDLYNLILENILVGKDNYNIDKMSNLILDYASWSQITWEQYDILLSLMKMQHEPIIEEDGDIDAIN